jgi:glycosyltransferase involved in cell wall biosynthesis
MPPITALLHCSNDTLRLGRTLETLLPCAEILIVDHHSTDNTQHIARTYGARIVTAEIVDAKHYADRARHDWIFCLQPGESLTEGLQASLFEWSALPLDSVTHKLFSVVVSEQSRDGRWQQFPAPEIRLVHRAYTAWQAWFPANEASAVTLEGQLLRFV